MIWYERRLCYIYLKCQVDLKINKKKPFSKKCDSKLRTHVVCMITLEVKRDQPKGAGQKGPAKKGPRPKMDQAQKGPCPKGTS